MIKWYSNSNETNCRRYVDDIYNRKNKIVEDSLFKALNSYHKNIKLTTEINPIKFLDIHLHKKDGIYVTEVHRKEIENQLIGLHRYLRDTKETVSK